MDFLSDLRGQEGGWAPTSERVFGAAELGAEAEEAEPARVAATASLTHVLAAPTDPDSLPSVPSFDQFSARPSHYVPVESPTPAPSEAPAPPASRAPAPAASRAPAPAPAPAPTPAPEPGPVPLTAEDLEALENLTYAELARARGIDPAEIERLSGVKLGRPAPRSTPASPPSSGPAPQSTAPSAAPAAATAPVSAASVSTAGPHLTLQLPTRATMVQPPPPAVPAPLALPTWPPADHVAAPIDRRRRPAWPKSGRSRRPIRRGVAALALLAVGGAGAWYFLVRLAGPSTPTAWDPRVASTAAFVAHEQGLPWKHPVRVVFLSGPSYRERFGASLASARGQSGPAGTDVADYVASSGAVYVSGTNLDYYSRFALTGQLTEALRDQYLGSASSADTRSAAAQAQFIYLGELSPAQLRDLHAQEAQPG